jgi:lipoate-protein ligase A
MSDWRLLDTGPGEASWNMAVDEALSQEVRDGRSRPVLRFYTWAHPAISCGYFQDIERELDLEACRQRGVAVVRRPTGGRAVYHDTDLTISLAALESEPGIGSDIGETYRKIAQAIAQGLQASGLPVELVRTQASGRELFSTPSCFGSKARHELVLRGRKIFGGAQRRREGVVLSQGSLQLWGDGGVPAELMRKGIHHIDFESKVPDEGPKVPLDEAKAGIRKGFRRVFEVELSLEGLAVGEREAALLIAPKYSFPRKEWEAHFVPNSPKGIIQPCS